MWNKSLNIFAEKMNYNYILYKLILCILGYMFWNNTRQMLKKTQVIQIQNDWRYNSAIIVHIIHIIYAIYSAIINYKGSVKQWTAVLSLSPWCKPERSDIQYMYSSSSSQVLYLITLLFRCFFYVTLSMDTRLTVALASLAASRAWNGFLKTRHSSY